MGATFDPKLIQGKSSPYLIEYLLDKSQEEELLIHITRFI